MKPKLLISSLVVSVLLLAGTGFAYQGQLKNASGPVTGVCDMAFQLHSDASADAHRNISKESLRENL